MRILQLHCDYVEYTPVKKEIKSAEEITPESKRLEEIVVAFVAVEESDNADVAKRAITEISESMKKIGCSKLLLYPYAHLSSKLASPTAALLLLQDMEKNAQGLEVYRAPFGWTKSYKLQVKGHPLAENSKSITAGEEKEKDSSSNALKAESKIQSYWHILT
ncbi:MAG: threonyl-tRNA synthetase editing domain-containing protein, partial [Nitrosotalea sp.]